MSTFINGWVRKIVVSFVNQVESTPLNLVSMLIMRRTVYHTKTDWIGAPIFGEKSRCNCQIVMVSSVGWQYKTMIWLCAWLHGYYWVRNRKLFGPQVWFPLEFRKHFQFMVLTFWLNNRAHRNFVHWPETSSINWAGCSEAPMQFMSTGAIATCRKTHPTTTTTTKINSFEWAPLFRIENF